MVDKKALDVEIYQSPFQDREDGGKEGEYRKYEIPYQDRMTVMSVLDYVHQNYDRSLTYYKSCRIGKCTGCFMEVNGKNKLACTTLARDGMRIGPMKKRQVIRDLLVEL